MSQYNKLLTHIAGLTTNMKPNELGVPQLRLELIKKFWKTEDKIKDAGIRRIRNSEKRQNGVNVGV